LDLPEASAFGEAGSMTTTRSDRAAHAEPWARPLTLVDLDAVGLASLARAVTVAVQRWTADRV